MNVRMALSFRAALVIVVCACADPPRDNVFDPVNTPTIEMSAPVQDGTTVLIEWRYILEGQPVDFEVVRSSSTSNAIEDWPATVVGRVSASPTPDWATATVRDTSITYGATFLYQVRALASEGGILTTATKEFFAQGTLLDSVADPDRLVIELSWSNVPEDVVGFELSRATTSSGPEVIFSSQDASDRRFTDMDFEGNTVYSYELRTVLPNQVSFTSTTVQPGMFMSLPPEVVDVRAGERLLLADTWPVILSSSTALVVRTGVGRYNAIDLSDLDLATASVEDTSIDSPGGVMVCAFSRETDEVVMVSVSTVAPEVGAPLPPSVVEASERWPSSGGTRTGVAKMGHEPAVAGYLLFSGTELRRLALDFALEEETTIQTGEPIDIDYQNRSIWLAYPDRLLKSTPLVTLSDLTWEEIPLPEGTVITSIHTFWPNERMLMLDGVNAKIHLLEASGIVLSWDAIGTNLEQGEITERVVSGVVVQSDGRGGRFTFAP